MDISSNHPTKTLLVFLTFLALFLFACGGGDSDSEAQDLTITPTLESSNASKSSLDNSGGTIVATGNDGTEYTLEIPPEALNENVEITLTPISNIPDLDFLDQFLFAVEFGPEGLNLAVPATLTVQIPDGVDLPEIIGFSWENSGSNVNLVSRKYEQGSLTFTIGHFSGVGAGTGDAEKAKALLKLKESAEAEFQSQLADKIQKFERGFCVKYPPECIDQFNDLTIYQMYIDGLNEVLLEGLGEWLEATSPYDILYASDDVKEIVLEYLQWEFVARRELCGSEGICDLFEDNFGVQAEITRNDIADIVVLRIREARDECNDIKLTYILDTLIFTESAFSNRFREILADRLGDLDADELQSGIRQDYACHLQVETEGFPEKFEKGGFDVINFSISLINSQSSSGTPLSNIDAFISTGGEGCGNIESETETTDESGRIYVGMTANSECSNPEDKVVLYIRVDDNRIANDNDAYFLGKVIKLEADAIDCRRIIPTRPVNGALRDFANGLDPICEGVIVTTSPASAVLTPGDSQQFEAIVTGATDDTITWTATGGIIDPNGLFTAGDTEGDFTITATSDEDPSVFSSSNVTIENQSVDIPTFGIWSGAATIFSGSDETDRQIAMQLQISNDGSVNIEIPSTTSATSSSSPDFGGTCRSLWEGNITGNQLTATIVNHTFPCNDARAIGCPLTGTITYDPVNGIYNLVGIMDRVSARAPISCFNIVDVEPFYTSFDVVLEESSD